MKSTSIKHVLISFIKSFTPISLQSAVAISIIEIVTLALLVSVGCGADKTTGKNAKGNLDPVFQLQPKDPCGIEAANGLAKSANESSSNFEYVKGSVIYSVCLRGVRGMMLPADFIVDTGTNNSIVDKNIAQMLAFRQTGTTSLVAPGGTVATQVVEGEMSMAGQAFEKVSLTVQDLAPYSRVHQKGIDGILGVSYLKKYIVDLDYGNRRIDFLRERKERFSLLATIPFRVENGLPLVICRFPNSVENEVIIDTGHVHDLQIYEDLSKELYLGPPVSTGKVGGASDSHNVSFHRVESIYLNNYRIDNVTMDVHPLITPNSFKTKFKPGLLGQGILGRFTIELDFLSSNLRLFKRA